MGVMRDFSWVLLSIFLDLNSRTSALHESCAHMYNFQSLSHGMDNDIDSIAIGVSTRHIEHMYM